jgi:hypothetical protein
VSILNSYFFIETVQRYYTIQVDYNKMDKILSSYGIKIVENEMNLNDYNKSLEKYVDEIINQIIKDHNNNSNSRIYVNGFENLIEELIGKSERKFFKNRKSL